MFTAATLLIPGYVDAAEARSIAGFRTELDTGISLASFVRARALGIKGMDEFMRRAE